MTKMIIISILIAFSVSMSFFFIIYGVFPPSHMDPNNDFFKNSLLKNEDQILIFGSSQVGQLNVEIINSQISTYYNYTKAYNLAYNGDSPKKRIHTLQEIIDLNPKIIVYGISYRDFVIPNYDSGFLLPDPKKLFYKLLDDYSYGEKINPQFFTLSLIRDNFADMGIFPKQQNLKISNTPFYEYSNNLMKILPSDIINNSENISKTTRFYFGDLQSNSEIHTFEQILDRLNQNNIQVIIFLTPLHKSSLNQISDVEEDGLQFIMEKISERNIPILDLRKKYIDLDIFADWDHVALNDDSSTYSHDISKFIIKEIGE
jgi:hypothetical protein